MQKKVKCFRILELMYQNVNNYFIYYLKIELIGTYFVNVKNKFVTFL